MRTAIFIPVRSESTRLPQKALLKAGQKCMLEHLINRARLSKIKQIVVCTTHERADDRIVEISRQCGVDVFRGNTTDVLDRYLNAAIEYGVEYIINVDGDDIFCEPYYMNRLSDLFDENDYDYINIEGLPIGLYPVGMKTSALKKVCEIKDDKNTEGWGRYFTKTGLFRTYTLTAKPEHRLNELRLTLDYQQDFDLISRIISSLESEGRDYYIDDILSLVKSQPDLLKINDEVKDTYWQNFNSKYSEVKLKKENLLNFLVIGLGSMGKRRVRNLIALGIQPQNIFGFDTRADRMIEAAGKYKIKTVEKIEEIDFDQIKGAVISVPPDLHMEYALFLAEKKIPMFIEASVLDDKMQELIKLEEKYGIVVCPSYTMGLFPAPQKVKEIVSGGKIGAPLYFTYHSGQYLPDWHPWESIMDFYVSKRETGGCREIVPFEMTWLVDVFGRPSKITCMKNKLSNMKADIDDIYNLLIEFNTGIVGHLCVDVISKPAIRFMRVTGSEGTLEWDENGKKIKFFTAVTGKWEEIKLDHGTVEKNYINPEEPYINEMKLFIDSINGPRVFKNTLKSDYEILQFLYQAEKSFDRGMHVSV